MIYNITPVAKPRMTRQDKWKKRKPVLMYWAYKQECQLKGVKLPDNDYHVTFILPMPKSWTLKKRAEMNGKPHKQKPDKDNLEKGLLDAIFKEDSHVWDGRVTKLWGEQGQIIIEEIKRGE